MSERIDERIITLSSQLRKICNELEEIRKEVNEVKQQKLNTTKMLNYIIRKYGEITINTDDITKDLSLSLDCTMVKFEDDHNFTMYYSVDELEKQIEIFNGSGAYEKLKAKVEELK